MDRERAYRVLCGAAGGILVLAGVAFTFGGFAALRPYGTAPGPIPMGPGGVYYLAMSGAALLGWGGALLVAARNAAAARALGPLTAGLLCLMAVFQMWAWLWGDYHTSLGEFPRYGAMGMLVLASAFVWLNPARTNAPTRMATRVRRGLATAGIVVLLGVDLWLPVSAIAARQDEERVRADVAELAVNVGDRLPELGLLDLAGDPLSLADFRGHPTLVTFERSVDW